jgi:hypothetical protein
MTRPRVSDVRKDIPLSVKLAAALRMLGFTKDDHVQYDHDPALGLRDWDEEKWDFVPPQLDPEYIVIRTRAAHRTKTSGRKGEARVTSYGSDAHAIAKIDRLEKDQAAFRAKLLSKGNGAETPEQSRSKSRMQSRGFNGKSRPFRTGKPFSSRRTVERQT